MADEIGTVETDQADTTPEEQTYQDADDTADTFPRDYVEKLRGEAKDNRKRAETAEQNLDAALRELFTFKVTATGKLADSDDLAFDPELLTDNDKLNAAIDDLVSRKPHLKSRYVSGNIG